MKVCLLGDTHIGARNDSPVFHNFFAKFYNDVFFPYLKENNILHVVQLGDVFDRRKYINFNSLKLAREYFFEKLNKDYTSWMLVGNHDTYYKNTNEVNSLELLLGQYHNINVVNEPTVVDFEEVSTLLVPWMSEANYQHCIEQIQKTNCPLVVGHFEIDGFEMYKGAVHEGGITRDLFANIELVVSGHFHHKSSHYNIHYLGTPYEITWSDFNDPKGFHIYDTDTRELTFIQNPYSMFHKIHYDDANKQIEDVVNIDFLPYRDSFVKLIVRNKTNPYCFDLFVDKLEKAGVYNVQVVDDHFHMDMESDDDIVSEAEDTLTILTKHVRQLDFDKKQNLEKLMSSLYNEALTLE